MASQRFAVLCAALIVCVSARPSFCAGEDPGEEGSASMAESPPREIASLNAFLSFHYGYNFNRPPSGVSRLRVFDFDDNTFEADVAEVVIQHPAALGEGGFRADLTAGSTIPKVVAASGLSRDAATAEAEDFDLQQVFVSYVVRLGRGLRFDAGKFVTHMGYEVIEGYDNFNDNASRSFLFGYAIPFTHTGVRVSYPVSSAVSAQIHVVNGWDNARDNNKEKSLGLQLGFTPSGSLSAYLNAMSGPEKTANDADRRSIADIAVIWKAGARLVLGMNADYGEEENLFGAGRDGIWSGAAGYLRFNATERFALAARCEEFNDRNGARTGGATKLREATLTPEVRLDEHVVLRVDLRRDWSDKAVFEKRSGDAKEQSTALVNLIWAH